MNKLVLATGSDNNYLGRIYPYVNSILANSNFDANVLAFLSDDVIISHDDKLIITNISPAKIQAKNKNNCIQHGEFMYGSYFEQLNEDDVIVFTDGDIILQRPLTDEESVQFRSLKDGDVFVGYNASPSDTLFLESTRLGQLQDTPPELQADWNVVKIYNTGVLAMNKKTWLKLIDDYVELFPVVDRTFDHYAKQQWLISFIIGTRNYNIVEMPYEIHSHHHYYPEPLGASTDKNGIASYGDKVILFKHGWRIEPAVTI